MAKTIQDVRKDLRAGSITREQARAQANRIRRSSSTTAPQSSQVIGGSNQLNDGRTSTKLVGAGQTSERIFTPGQSEQTQGVRRPPTVPTPTNPVTTIGGTAQKNQEPTFRDVLIKQAKGEDLNDAEIGIIIDEQMKRNEAQTLESTGFQTQLDEINRIIGNREKEGEETAKLIREEENAALDLGTQRINERFNRQIQSAQRLGKDRVEAQQSAFSFSGFGRSTKNAENIDNINKEVADHVASLEAARAAEQALLEAQLRGASDEEIKGIRANIDNLKNKAAEIEASAIQKVAELNAENQVTGQEALSNLVEALAATNKSSAAKVSPQASELLGYISDEYGNPLVTDANGNPVPVNQEQDQVKWEKYEDSYTGETFFYNPYDPTQIRRAPGGTIQSYTSPTGQVTSSPTTTTEGMQIIDAGEYLNQYADNCVFFARDGFVPNIPGDAKSVPKRIKGIEIAKKGGFGGDDMRFAQAGDAIHTSEGDVGHTAVIEEIFTTPEGRFASLIEANYIDDKITRGRTISLDDPKILGWIRPTQTAPIGFSNPFEGSNLGIQDQVSGNFSFTPDQEREFQSFAEKGSLPSFKGRTQQEKDQQEAKFRSNYNLWASQNPDVVPEYDFDMANTLRDDYKSLTGEVQALEEGFSVTRNLDINHNNGATDISLIFAFNKVNDPRSVVREGEFEIARSSGSFLDSIGAKWNQIIEGKGLLTPDLRQKIVDEMNRQYDNKKVIYDKRLTNAVNIGKDFNIPARAYLDFLPGEEVTAPDFNAPSIEQFSMSNIGNLIQMGASFFNGGELPTFGTENKDDLWNNLSN